VRRTAGEPEINAQRQDTMCQRPFLRRVESYKVIATIHVVVSCKFLEALPSTNIPEYLPNLKRSHLHQLPTEFIFLVLDKLAEGPEALLSIHLVSRNFNPSLNCLLQFYDKSVCAQDNTFWYSHWERIEGLSSLLMAVCCTCKSTHAR
jgi:hypothetical protein